MNQETEQPPGYRHVNDQERRLIQYFHDRAGFSFHMIGLRLDREPQTVKAHYERDRGNPDYARDPEPLPGRERTLVLFKPDAVRRRLVGKLIERFEYIGLDLIQSRRTTITNPNVVHQHHPDLLSKHGEVIAAAVVDYMTSGPLIAAIFEGLDAIASARNLIGPTFPEDARPRTIRGAYGRRMTREGVLETGVMSGNVVHGSRTAAEARRELAMWFGGSACGR